MHCLSERKQGHEPDARQHPRRVGAADAVRGRGPVARPRRPATAEEPDRWVRSCCVLCSNGCGLDIGVKDGRIVGVRGLETDRVNRGRLGPKGLHGWQANHSPDRLTAAARPRRRRASGEATWDEAMGLVVARCRETMEQFTPGAVGVLQHRPAVPRRVLHPLARSPRPGSAPTTSTATPGSAPPPSSQALRETFGSRRPAVLATPTWT